MSEPNVHIEQRGEHGKRCAYCHGALGGKVVRCKICHSECHLECRRELARCPTLGCDGGTHAPAPQRTAPLEMSPTLARPRPLPGSPPLWAYIMATLIFFGIPFVLGIIADIKEAPTRALREAEKREKRAEEARRADRFHAEIEKARREEAEFEALDGESPLAEYDLETRLIADSRFSVDGRGRVMATADVLPEIAALAAELFQPTGGKKPAPDWLKKGIFSAPRKVRRHGVDFVVTADEKGELEIVVGGPNLTTHAVERLRAARAWGDAGAARRPEPRR